MGRVLWCCLVVAAFAAVGECFVAPATPRTLGSRVPSASASRSLAVVDGVLRMSANTEEKVLDVEDTEEKVMDLEETTEKYGLEAGLFQAFKDGGQDKGQQAKDLLKRYGSAYLITSIFFAIISFSICYVAVDSGVDIAALLSKVGIDASASVEKAGTFAVAYAAHKAASPIRFPPTVALTPVVAKWLGREEAEAGTEE